MLGYSQRRLKIHYDEFLVEGGVEVDRILAVFENSWPEECKVLFEISNLEMSIQIPGEFFPGRSNKVTEDIEDEIYWRLGVCSYLKQDELMKAIGGRAHVFLPFPPIQYARHVGPNRYDIVRLDGATEEVLDSGFYHQLELAH